MASFTMPAAPLEHGDFISLVSLTDGELIICNSHIHGVVYDAGSALGADKGRDLRARAACLSTTTRGRRG